MSEWIWRVCGYWRDQWSTNGVPIRMFLGTESEDFFYPTKERFGLSITAIVARLYGTDIEMSCRKAEHIVLFAGGHLLIR
jgi:hypothetical protein